MHAVPLSRSFQDDDGPGGVSYWALAPGLDKAQKVTWGDFGVTVLVIYASNDF